MAINQLERLEGFITITNQQHNGQVDCFMLNNRRLTDIRGILVGRFKRMSWFFCIPQINIPTLQDRQDLKYILEDIISFILYGLIYSIQKYQQKYLMQLCNSIFQFHFEFHNNQPQLLDIKFISFNDQQFFGYLYTCILMIFWYLNYRTEQELLSKYKQQSQRCKILRHKCHIYLIREFDNGTFKIVSTLNFQNEVTCGTMTNNGQYLVFQDNKSAKYLSYELLYQ
ncbi:unnamed protein product [Paramecium octaurelia]|uniref:Transmembrane protein n=1 Tax=Paramecium octaurelia TaxID=43137 RepID=A0A8S1YDA2_PAROT|nr:unnamed protein product [Paramecium octaurelia]